MLVWIFDRTHIYKPIKVIFNKLLLMLTIYCFNINKMFIYTWFYAQCCYYWLQFLSFWTVVMLVTPQPKNLDIVTNIKTSAMKILMQCCYCLLMLDCAEINPLVFWHHNGVLRSFISLCCCCSLLSSVN